MMGGWVDGGWGDVANATFPGMSIAAGSTVSREDWVSFSKIISYLAPQFVWKK